MRDRARFNHACVFARAYEKKVVAKKLFEQWCNTARLRGDESCAKTARIPRGQSSLIITI